MCTREWRQPTAVDGGSKDRNRMVERRKGTNRSEIGERGDRQTAPSSIIADDDDSKCGPGLSPTRTDVSVG